MANGGKDVRLGDDKRPVTVIPNSEDNLYNIANGEILTDEFGTPLVTEVDQFFTADASSSRSTSIVFPEFPEDSYGRTLFAAVDPTGQKTGIFPSVTYNTNFDVGINTAHVKQVGGGVVGFGTTVALADGSPVQVAIANTQFNDFHWTWEYLDIKTVTDQGTDLRNKLYFPDDVLSNVRLEDKVVGAGIDEASFISRIYPSYVEMSRNVDASVLSGITTATLQIRRATKQLLKADNVLRIEEQFRETSEVSQSLLGIPRAETQLSLFSNVSSYGLNDDEFEFFTFNGGNSFGSWDKRANKIYGNRYNAGRKEEVQESAIRLEAFPVPYSFPFNSLFGEVGFYDEELFGYYIRFIQLGNRLYNYFSGSGGSGYPAEWKDKFLNQANVTVVTDNVEYLVGITDGFAFVDTWTDTWRDITVGALTDPVTKEPFDFAAINGLNLVGSPYSSSTTRPGYSSTDKKYSYLQSRRVFRYQPGRISGFTFGLRASTEPQPGAVLEWGIKNPTDQYMFRIEAGNLFIVRRSTIPLPASALARSGLEPLDQVFESAGDPYDGREYWTIKVPSDKFNHDALTGNGPSGYNIKPENVTMWKIEFGWYGAIGCRFYAYIPAGPGEARWVKVHTFVIENSIDQPCLQDSYFRFSYSLDITDAALLKEPVFLYKYGASYYIDGGDEGTSRIYSVSSKEKTINSISNRTLVGITPKNFILNSVGTEIKNKQLIIPTTMNITSDSLAKVEVVKCRACPGYAHVYTPGIAATTTGPEVQVKLIAQDQITAVSGTSFKQSDLYAKVIAPTIWNAYIVELRDEISSGGSPTGTFETAVIKGYGGVDGYPTLSAQVYDSLVYDGVAGITTTLASGPTVADYPYPVRLSSKENHYVASDFKFTGNKIEIQYLTPDALDNYGHYADFTLGITNYTPQISGVALQGFNKPGLGLTTMIHTQGTNPEAVFMDYTHTRVSQNENGVKTSEVFSTGTLPGRGGLDSRIPRPAGDATGFCSLITIEVLDASQVTALNEVNYLPGPGSDPSIPDPLGRLFLLKAGVFPSGIDFDGGQVKLTTSSTPSSAIYVGEVQSYTDGDGNIFSYIQVSQTVASPDPDFSIDIRPVRLTTPGNPIRQKLFNFDPFPLYFFGKLSDNAAVNNISIKETSGGFQRTISPKFYAFGDNTAITNASGQADVSGEPPTNFIEVTRLSSALTDIQNRQRLRPTTLIDTVYIGEDQTLEVDMSKTFGQDRNVITPDNNNIEATFLVAQRIPAGSGTIETTLNYKEQ